MLGRHATMTRHADRHNERSPIEITDITVAGARRGDHAALGALGGAAFRRIVTFYRYTGVSVDAAEDLAADAVEQIITKLPTLRDVSAYDAWMWTITRNLLRDHWRRGKVGDPVEPITPSPPGPEELTVIREEHADIRAALRTLPLRDRELLWFREVLELDYRSIGERVDMSAATTRVACHRARARLQRAYEARSGSTGDQQDAR
jgi:RNA polymerase sigma factor (sigma-70 family)